MFFLVERKFFLKNSNSKSNAKSVYFPLMEGYEIKRSESQIQQIENKYKKQSINDRRKRIITTNRNTRN